MWVFVSSYRKIHKHIRKTVWGLELLFAGSFLAVQVRFCETPCLVVSERHMTLVGRNESELSRRLHKQWLTPRGLRGVGLFLDTNWDMTVLIKLRIFFNMTETYKSYIFWKRRFHTFIWCNELVMRPTKNIWKIQPKPIKWVFSQTVLELGNKIEVEVVLTQSLFSISGSIYTESFSWH